MEIKARAEDTGGALGVLEGQIRFRVPQAFKVESERARALVVFTPGGLERMWEAGGMPAGESAERP